MTKHLLVIASVVLLLSVLPSCSTKQPPEIKRPESPITAPASDNKPDPDIEVEIKPETAKDKYEVHMDKLLPKIPDGFNVIVQKPFIVISNDTQARTKRYAEKTVKWAVDKLKKDYFTKDPDEIIDIWLFNNGPSYKKYAKEIFNDEPGTPYGYYSPYHKALIMNISTGGGTLVHEIVHPFMRANFPECPDWFNEGLASLYEQCGEKNGHINGYTNWRLENLQTLIRNNTLPSFKELMALEFYGNDKGDNYAQARYLCYYLQEHGKLVTYYHEFRKNAKRDPTGYNTLVQLLNIQDITKFEHTWKRWILTLTFP